MITALVGSTVRRIDLGGDGALRALREAPWVDLLDPAPDEVKAVEAALDLELPTRREVQEIEVSSRLYVENHTAIMTVTVLVRADSPHPETTPVTFLYQPRRLVTLRFAEPTPFATFTAKLLRSPKAFGSAQAIFMGLVDEVIDRVADILESVGTQLNDISAVIFADVGTRKIRPRSVDYTAVLSRIGQNGERAANARESLLTLSRLLTFFAETRQAAGGDPLDEHWRTARRDVASLADHATFLSNKVNFFLDATLGRINIEQNEIIKMFSVLAVIFLPPTLIASVYGMNFDRFPELHWRFGYPLSLVLMFLSGVIPYVFFRRRGWFR